MVWLPIYPVPPVTSTFLLIVFITLAQNYFFMLISEDKYHLIELVNETIVIARKAALAVMEVYIQDFDVTIKSDTSPLTQADLASNKIIVAGLKGLTPEFPIISEESDEIDFEIRKNHRYLWCVDPLDGTKEFVNKNGEFAINIALLEDGKPILGVVGLPAVNQVSWAVKGYGAFLEKDGMVCRLQCKEILRTQSSFNVVCSRSHLDKDTVAYAERFGKVNWMPKGSSMKFVMIAGGEADFYPRLGPTMEWDTAAPHIIVEEAGGKVLDKNTMRPLTYNKESLYNPDFVVFGAYNY